MAEAERRPDHRQADGPVVGLTGARFGGAAGRRRRRTDPERPPREPEQPYREPERPSREPDRQYQVAQPRAAAATELGTGDAVGEADWVLPEEAYDLVRPYSWTGGRTASSHDLPVEALISATGPAPDPAVSPEHHTIYGLCTTPRSVAELAALLSVPLGVVRVVLGDMTVAGSVLVHDTAGSADGTPDLALMQRVLDCLQRL